MMTAPDRTTPSQRPRLRAMTSDLRNRLLLLLVLPLCALALVGVWLDYRSADEAAGRHDQRLLRLLPALADSVLAPSIRDNEPPLLLLAPPVEEFLRQNTGFAGYSVRDISGRLLLGDDWVHGAVPTTQAPEFHSVEFGGVTYRVAVQRGRTGAGEMVVALADGSDPRQQWAQQLLLRVLLPNLVLVAAAALAIHWAVGRAFKPLVDLAEAVEHRSPRDLSPIDEASSPAEVRPLVHSLNRLFALVNAQAEGQRRFVADAAHQLRTPLAGLKSQTRLALEAATDDDQRSRLALVHQSATRSAHLVAQLLTLARAEPGSAAVLERTQFDLRRFAQDIVVQLVPRGLRAGVDLGFEDDEGAEPVPVQANSLLLREALTNLIDNAIQYAGAGAEITVKVRREGASALLVVEDDGPGIPEADRARVFERFFRATYQGDGCGLGLAIVKEIVERHSGSVTLEEVQPHGLRVLIRLPPEA